MSDVTPQVGVEPQVQAPVTAVPWVLVHPYISIGTTPNDIEIHCAATNLKVEAAQDESKKETFCGAYVSFKPVVWTITATSLMSYGTTGLWNLLQPMMGTVVPFEVRPDTGVASPTNPSMKGTAMVKWVDFINGNANEISECDVVLAVQGAPTFATA